MKFEGEDSSYVDNNNIENDDSTVEGRDDTTNGEDHNTDDLDGSSGNSPPAVGSSSNRGSGGGGGKSRNWYQCRRCRYHGQFVFLAGGHYLVCPYRKCTCQACRYVSKDTERAGQRMREWRKTKKERRIPVKPHVPRIPAPGHPSCPPSPPHLQLQSELSGSKHTPQAAPMLLNFPIQPRHQLIGDEYLNKQPMKPSTRIDNISPHFQQSSVQQRIGGGGLPALFPKFPSSPNVPVSMNPPFTSSSFGPIRYQQQPNQHRRNDGCRNNPYSNLPTSKSSGGVKGSSSNGVALEAAMMAERQMLMRIMLQKQQSAEHSRLNNNQQPHSPSANSSKQKHFYADNQHQSFVGGQQQLATGLSLPTIVRPDTPGSIPTSAMFEIDRLRDLRAVHDINNSNILLAKQQQDSGGKSLLPKFGLHSPTSSSSSCSVVPQQLTIDTRRNRGGPYGQQISEKISSFSALTPAEIAAADPLLKGDKMATTRNPMLKNFGNSLSSNHSNSCSPASATATSVVVNGDPEQQKQTIYDDSLLIIAHQPKKLPKMDHETIVQNPKIENDDSSSGEVSDDQQKASGSQPDNFASIVASTSELGAQVLSDVAGPGPYTIASQDSVMDLIRMAQEIGCTFSMKSNGEVCFKSESEVDKSLRLIEEGHLIRIIFTTSSSKQNVNEWPKIGGNWERFLMSVRTLLITLVQLCTNQKPATHFNPQSVNDI